jgi:hypothetical protein
MNTRRCQPSVPGTAARAFLRITTMRGRTKPMSKPKTTTSATADAANGASLVAQSSKPLVFISHDSRDAELAMAFENLLTDASGGNLKSFRSSDKTGKAGMEEVKVLFRDLPQQVERKLNDMRSGPRKRLRNFHPAMLEEIMHGSFAKESKTFGWWLLISLLRDDAPWLYEVGMGSGRETR